jgi:aspartate 1-decarboxylase
MRFMLRSKIHGARVTDANVEYEGSITLDRDLMEQADILPYEQVHVLDVDNGARLTTYAIEGPAGSGVVCINGAAARLVEKGHKVIILTYQQVREEEAKYVRPTIVHLNAANLVRSRC